MDQIIMKISSLNDIFSKLYCPTCVNIIVYLCFNPFFSINTQTLTNEILLASYRYDVKLNMNGLIWVYLQSNVCFCYSNNEYFGCKANIAYRWPTKAYMKEIPKCWKRELVLVWRIICFIVKFSRVPEFDENRLVFFFRIFHSLSSTELFPTLSNANQNFVVEDCIPISSNYTGRRHMYHHWRWFALEFGLYRV